jgi:hypothetical protein
LNGRRPRRLKLNPAANRRTYGKIRYWFAPPERAP